jgi:hypothetical protein
MKGLGSGFWYFEVRGYIIGLGIKGLGSTAMQVPWWR